MLYSDDEYKLFSEELEGCSIGTVWSAMRADNFDKKILSYEEKKDYFLELLQLLIEDGKIKLASHGKFLTGSTEEQINRFREALPQQEEGLYHDLWFTFEECPGGIVWIYENGYEDWT
ncbi:DUF596 domain-containing protein [Salmonella enterica]|nr:DUF596 domain-containing protein [Salmonella enterica]EBC5055187.1 DUF596 domain-containing protein [Salmonella enterica]ECX8200039.1 DUF596 domain-containing protein [Salmonella enterica]EDC3785874.1 DUF596 domain-containing protein [Salmonella enterica]ELE6319720.1 DUF596 domain-containing protein [Salmonella enterica]